MALAVREEELASIRDEWSTLLEGCPEPAPFLHPTWHRVWLEEFQNGREPLLLSVRDGETLLGVAPLLRDGPRLSLAGDPSICDYMDVVAAPDSAGEIHRALVDDLLERSWHELELWGVRDSSPTLRELPPLAEAAGLSVEREQEARAPRVELPASWDEYVSGLRKKDRHELRRKLRRLGGSGETELHSYTAPDDVESHLPVLLRFMAESRTDKAQFLSEQMGRFFHRMVRALASEGLVRLYELELDGKAVASVLCFDQGGQLFMYNSGYDPDYASLAVGLASKAMLLGDAIEAGRHCVDFLRGDEAYKYGLGGKDQVIYRLLVRRT